MGSPLSINKTIELGGNVSLPSPSSGDNVEYLSSENEFFNYDAAAGFPLWLDEDTLRFIFAIRYSSPAFTGTYLQESYRNETHRQFSSLIKDLIQQKIDSMRRMPELYSDAKPKMKVFDESLIDKDNVIEIGKALGIDAAKIDVYTVVSDVTESLQHILDKLIKERPGMSPAEKRYAMEFLDEQLWDDDAKAYWRDVSAEELAKLYSYDDLPRSMRIIHALDEYIHNEFKNGSMQSIDVRNAYVGSMLSDDVIEDVREALDDNDASSEPANEDWVIQDAIAGNDDSWD